MKYYKVYNFNGHAFVSVKSLKERMRAEGVKKIEIIVDYRRNTNGQLDVCKNETFSVRLSK